MTDQAMSLILGMKGREIIDMDISLKGKADKLREYIHESFAMTYDRRAPAVPGTHEIMNMLIDFGYGAPIDRTQDRL